MESFGHYTGTYMELLHGWNNILTGDTRVSDGSITKFMSQNHIYFFSSKRGSVLPHDPC